jgi:hypothetical protein
MEVMAWAAHVVAVVEGRAVPANVVALREQSTELEDRRAKAPIR